MAPFKPNWSGSQHEACSFCDMLLELDTFAKQTQTEVEQCQSCSTARCHHCFPQYAHSYSFHTPHTHTHRNRNNKSAHLIPVVFMSFLRANMTHTLNSTMITLLNLPRSALLPLSSQFYSSSRLTPAVLDLLVSLSSRYHSLHFGSRRVVDPTLWRFAH